MDIPCGTYLLLAERLDKQNKNHKFEIKYLNLYFKRLPSFLFTFASILSRVFFAHWRALSLPLNTYSTGISKPYPAPRLILFPVTNTLIIWFGKEKIFLNVKEYKNGTWPTTRGPIWLECVTANAFSLCMLSSYRLQRRLSSSKCVYGLPNIHIRMVTASIRVVFQNREAVVNWEFQHQKEFPFCLVDHWSSLHFVYNSTWIQLITE